METRILFTKAALLAVAVPSGRDRVYVYDTRVPGLAFCLTAKGRTSFYVYRRINGRPERIRLGAFPDLTIEQARTEAAGKLGDIARGKNPQAEKRALRAETTFGELFQRYLVGHAKPKKRSWQDDEEQFDRHLDQWKSRRISSIDKDAVSTLHAKLGTDSGPYAANRVLALISAVFNFVISRAKEKWKGDNPAKGVGRFKEHERERFLQPDELPAFFTSLDAEPNETIRDYVYVSLLTGARRGNVMAMAWADVNLTRATWTIPMTKGGKPQTVHLHPAALAVLTNRRPADESDSPYVFPGRGGKGHLSESKATWAAILKRAGIKDLRLHDLRRTLGSFQAASGASLTVIGKSLGHRNVATTAIYARLSLDSVRASVDTAVDAMFVAGGKAIVSKEKESDAKA